MELLFLDDPCLDSLRSDPRFIDLIRGINLHENVYLSLPGPAT